MSQFNNQAEQIILGTILTYPDVTAIAVQELRPEHFYDTFHQTCFKGIVTLFRKSFGVDLLTVYNEIKNDISNRTPADLAKLQNSVGSKAHFDYHVAIVKDLWMKRELMRLGAMIQAEAKDRPDHARDIISDLLSNIYELSHETTKDVTVIEYFARMQQGRLERNGVRRGYKTKLSALDDALYGLLPGDLTVIAGRPGQGKTAFALNILLNLAVKQNIPSCFFSLEMAGEQLLERSEAIHTGIKHENIANGWLTELDKNLLSEAHAEIGSRPIYISDMSRMDTTTLRAKLSLYKAKYDVKVCFVDYLQLVGTTGRKSDYERVSEVSMTMKAIAKEFDVSVVALAQLSRQVESRPDKMPQMSDLKESGQIEQDADRIIFLMRPEYYGMEVINVDGMDQPSAGKIIVKVAKNRHGAVPKPQVLKWNGEFMRVTDIESTGGNWQPVPNDYESKVIEAKQQDMPF